MNTALKQSILDVLNQNIYTLRQERERGIESISTRAHINFYEGIDKEIVEAIKTRDEFVAFCG
jgi:hypothetical protein